MQENDESLQSVNQKSEKIWFLRQTPGWSDLIPARSQIFPGKEPKGQTKMLWPASVIWDEISEI